MLKDLFLGFGAAILKTEHIRNSPLNAQIEPTTFCNLRCKMCIRNDKVVSPIHMSETVFHLAMKKLTPHRVVFAGAGEPLMNPRMAEMVSYCSQKRIPTLLSTNLALDVKTAQSVLSAGLTTLKVSLDAADRDTYGQVRGNAAYFDRVIENIRTLNDNHGKQTDIRLEFVMLKENIGSIPDFVKLADSLKIPRVYFRELQTEGMSENRRKELLSGFDFQELKRLMKAGLANADRLGVRTNLPGLMAEFDQILDIYNRASLPSLAASCKLPWLQMFVAANGDVSPCCALTVNSGIVTGNVVDGNRDDLLNGPAIACVRRGFKSGNMAPVCKDCIPRDFGKLLRMSRLLPSFRSNSKPS